MTLAVHPASPTNITVTWAHGKPSFSIEVVNLSITTQGKLNLLSALTPVLKMRFSFLPCCLSSPSPFPIYSQQSDLAEAARCCLLWSLTQSAFANHFQLPGKEELTRCFQTPLLSFTICYQVLRRGPLLSLERKGGLYIGPVRSSAGLLRLRWTQSGTLLESFFNFISRWHCKETWLRYQCQWRYAELSCSSPVLGKIAKSRGLAKAMPFLYYKE